jgi:hypothetical protein
MLLKSVSYVLSHKWNGTKLGRIWDGFCPEEAVGLSPGFQPWEPSKQMVRTERARDAPTVDLRWATFDLPPLQDAPPWDGVPGVETSG